MTLVRKTLRVLAVASSMTLLVGYVAYSQKAAEVVTVPAAQVMLSSTKRISPHIVLSETAFSDFMWPPMLNAAPIFDRPEQPRPVTLEQSRKPMMSSSKSGMVTLGISPTSLLVDFDSWLGRSQKAFNQAPEIGDAQAGPTAFLDAVRTFGVHSGDDDTTHSAVRQQIWGDRTPRIKETPPYASYRLDTLPAHMYGMTVDQVMMSSSKGAMVAPSVVLTQIEELAAFLTRHLFPAEEWTAPPPPFNSRHAYSFGLEGTSALARSLEQIEVQASLGAAARWVSPLRDPSEMNSSLPINLPASNKVILPKP